MQGLCFTIAIELMLAADVVIAADDCRFAQMEVKRGIMPGAGGSFRIVERAGWGNAMKWLLTGDEFDSAEALRIGLVQEVVAGRPAVRARAGLRAARGRAGTARRAGDDRERAHRAGPGLDPRRDACHREEHVPLWHRGRGRRPHSPSSRSAPRASSAADGNHHDHVQTRPAGGQEDPDHRRRHRARQEHRQALRRPGRAPRDLRPPQGSARCHRR